MPRLRTRVASPAFVASAWGSVAHQRGASAQRRRTVLQVGVSWAVRHEIGAVR